MTEALALTFDVNGKRQTLAVQENTILADLLRERLHFTSVKIGCDQGVCGACTVLLDGCPAIACMTFAFEVDGKRVTTIEGLDDGAGGLHPVQQAFVDGGAIQCGYCTPGMVLSVAALLEVSPQPDAATIRRWLGAHICRCTGYQMIVESVLAVTKHKLPSAGVARNDVS